MHNTTNEQHVAHFQRVLPRHLERERLSGHRLGRKLHHPAPSLVRSRAAGFAAERDRHLLARISPTPDRQRPVTLQYSMLGEKGVELYLGMNRGGGQGKTAEKTEKSFHRD